MYCSIISDLIFSHFVHINNLKCFSGHTVSQKCGFDWYLKWIFTFLRDQIVDKHRTYSNFLSIYFRYSNAPLSAPAPEQGTPPAETQTHVGRGCTGELPAYIIVMCSCVWRPALLKKNKTCSQRRKNTVTTQMFNVLHFRWTGHLPLAILYAPSASIWLLENSLHILLVRQPWRKLPHKTGRYCFWEQVLTQRGPFPAQSCLPPQCVSC